MRVQISPFVPSEVEARLRRRPSTTLGTSALGSLN
jgi:hypothetical protein